jgi:hypothetical protein
MLVSENQLDEWTRGNSRDAQGLIVELVWRLIAASSPNPKQRRFPLGDSIGQTGPDGVLDTDFGFDPFVPEGRSFWEIGTGLNAGAKATSDYDDLVAAVPEEVRRQSAFVFVTPLSGRRDWPHTWKEHAQASWLEERRRRNDWRDVRVIDGTGLIDWLRHFLSVELWLSKKMGLPAQHIETPEQRWAVLSTIGDPPPLSPNVFLSNRDGACAKLKEVFSGTLHQLQLDTHYRDQVVDFVSAYVANMDNDAKIDAVGRCLIVSSLDAWNALNALRPSHIFVADFDLDETNAAGARLLEKARRSGHGVIYGGLPGGIPHPNRVPIPSPKSHQIKEALEKARYTEERARALAQKSDGNLSSLLRCLQNFSLMPEWAQTTDAAELAIAELLGTWTERSEADKAVAEKLSKKAYGEWIEKIREIVHRPGTPLIHRDGVWKMIARYEGWYGLGPKLFDEHLDRLRETAVNVLRERDPQFELPADERYAASIHGKVLSHSRLLRHGLAESLALLGSHPKALTLCSFGKAEGTAILAVREVLAGADWVLWASLNDLLPLLAEAAPGEFLDAVEKALTSDPCPFDKVFSQEGSGVTGWNYMTGLLWGLETLAWDAEYLTRVLVILGELAARDPGGNWSNRPANSLATILLPWLPQTCAPVSKRQTGIRTLLNESPDVGWKLLLDLLPSSHQMSSGSHKPAWRQLIPDDWSRDVTHAQYWEQVFAYTELAISTAKQDLSKLADLIDRLNDLPPPARDQLLAQLRSETVVSMPEADRLPIWTELTDLVLKHRKFADAKWAMEPEVVNEIASVAERLAPTAPIYRYQRLFSERDFDLYEQKENYEEQQKELEERRQKAAIEVFAAGGVNAILEFATSVESPWRVGFALGVIEAKECESRILPDLLGSEIKSLTQFAGGFIWGRFRSLKWQWVDAIDTSKWSASQKGQFLAYLPFSRGTWDRAAQLLSEDEAPYWSKASANPYQGEKDLDLAIDRLVKHGRAYAAIGCLQKILYDKQPLDTQQAVRVLKAVTASAEDARSLDVHAIVQVITALQNNPDTNADDLFQIEWAFLPLLDRHHGGGPRSLEQRLADDPAFFCDIIRLLYRSENEEASAEESTEQLKNVASSAYRLLSKWRTTPGTQKDGTFKGAALIAWLEKVKATCAESGHLKSALLRVGHVLVFTPSDPDGLWLHRSAATVLNAKDAEDVRHGFTTELFNLRGFHWGTAGKEEGELSEKYRDQAETTESAGYHRLANALRELAASYARDAERQASRDPFDH